jgi:transcriptional regulator with XRE-family HTH domain
MNTIQDALAWRTDLGLTQKEACLLLGISAPVLRAIEKKKRIAPAFVRAKIMKLSQLSDNEIITKLEFEKAKAHPCASL